MIDSLKIGPTIFAVSEAKDLVVGGKTVWGDASLGDATIKVEKSLAPGPKRVVLLHEIVHVCLDYAGYRKIAQDEGVVDSLAHSLLQVLRDNPGLVEELLGE